MKKTFYIMSDIVLTVICLVGLLYHHQWPILYNGSLFIITFTIIMMWISNCMIVLPYIGKKYLQIRDKIYPGAFLWYWYEILSDVAITLALIIKAHPFLAAFWGATKLVRYAVLKALKERAYA